MRKRNLFIAAGSTLLAAVGLAGIPEDLQTWSRLVAMIDHDIARYLFVLLGLSGVAFLARHQITKTVRQIPIFRRGVTRLSGVDFAKPIDPADWENVEVYSLIEAACLWVDVEPHSPILDTRARSSFFKLRSAMVTGRLMHQKGIVQTLNEITHEKKLPTETSILSAIDLRRYADSIGNVPIFLQSVKVPAISTPTDNTEQEDDSLQRPSRRNSP